MFVMARGKNTNIGGKKPTKKKFGREPAPEEKFLDSTNLTVLETLPPAPDVVKAKEPIPEDQQRELFKWILEERRKIKHRDSQEKKQIDEEKAILKQLIRAKSIPTF